MAQSLTLKKMSKKPKTSNAWRALYTLYMLLRCLVLVTFSAKLRGNRIEVKQSRSGYVLVPVAILYLLYTYNYHYNIIWPMYDKFDNYIILIQRALFLFYWLIFVVVITSLILFQETTVAALQGFVHFHNLLTQYQFEINYRKIQVYVYNLFLFAILTTIIWDAVYLYSYEDMLFTLYSTYWAIVYNFCNLYIAGFMYLLAYHFYLINEQLAVLVKRRMRTYDDVFMFFLCCNLHNHQYSIALKLNKAFAIMMLLFGLLDYIHILYMIFIIYEYFTKSAERLVLINSIFLGTRSLFNVLAIVHSCTQACYEANRTIFMVHQVGNVIKNLNFQQKIHSLSLKMLNQNLIITAFGFFELNFPMVFMAIESFVSYFIILIQFRS